MFNRSNVQSHQQATEAKTVEPASPRLNEPSTRLRPSTTPLAPCTREVPPWERVELPIFQVDGQRYGGSSTANTGNLWGNWKGITGKDQKHRPSGAPPSSPSEQILSWTGSGLSDPEVPTQSSPPLLIVPRFGSIPGIPVSAEIEPSRTSFAMPRKSSAESGTVISPLDRKRKSSAISGPNSDLQILTPTALSMHLSNDSHELHIRRASAITQESRRSSNNPAHSKRELLPVPQSDWSDRDLSDLEGQPIADDDTDWDLMRVLQQTAPAKTADDRFAPVEGETIEFEHESMASYLNRKTALLMLWFPLGVSAPGLGITALWLMHHSMFC